MDPRLWGWIIDAIVILGMLYLSFVMALAGWLAGLRRGEAVVMLPVRGSRNAVIAAQIAFVIVGLALAAALMVRLWVPLPVAPPAAVVPALKVVGLALFVGGAALLVWARQTLGRMWGISTSREVKLLPDHRLITAGPYARVRHPMYSGWCAAVVGLLLIYWTWVPLVLLLFSLPVFYRRARLEERVLAARFGAGWQRYAGRTKLFIPLLW